MKKLLLLLPVTFLFFCSSIVFAGNITGKVLDGVTGDPLPGATVMLDGTNRGTITDLRGVFVLSGVETGQHSLAFRFIGYELKDVDVEVNGNNLIEIDVEMSPLIIQGEEVIVTAQAAGQRAAINQQINSNSLTNVVSAQRIQEIPEASAAEAVGRLPGVSLKGGSIVVRGLSPQYNKIQVDGIDMASTSLTGRSSSLGMISQYMLEGIEMTKSAMADHEADVIGARVNLIIKEAPKTTTFEGIYENGYNNLSESFGNQRVSLSGSSRFFGDKLGVFGQVSYERNSEATHSMGGSYKHELGADDEGNPIDVAKLGWLSLSDTRQKLVGRKGASLVLDYKTGLTKIKMSNFFSSSENETVGRSMNYSQANNAQARSMYLASNNLGVMTNALRIEQILGRFEIDGGVNHSYSKNETPEQISASTNDPNSIPGDVNWDVAPIDLPGQIPDDVGFSPEQANLNNFTHKTQSSIGRKLSADINIKTNFKVGDFVNVDLKAGAKYKYTTKETEKEQHKADVRHGYILDTRDVAHEYLDWFPTGDVSGAGIDMGIIGFKEFVDPDYYNPDLLLGDYTMDYMFDENKVREFHEFMWENPMNFLRANNKSPYFREYKASIKDDFHGEETYMGAYIMPTLSIGRNNLITLIPGVRYEKNKTSYTGQRLPIWQDVHWNITEATFSGLEVTRERENEYILPMLHLIVRPTKWAVVKSSYTHTLTRPSFRNLVPSWNVVGGPENNIEWRDPYLTPGLAKNTDINVSFHGNKLGLFSVGYFHKKIEDMIFWSGKKVILQKDLDAGKYDGLEENNKYTMTEAVGKAVSHPINNPNDSYVSGIEVEYQSNLYFLPGVLSGLVFNANYTYFKSDAKYPAVNVVVDEDFNSPTFLESTYIDTFFVSRLLNQADHIFNISLGWDYRAFSIRGSMKFTDGLFYENHPQPHLRQYAAQRYTFDVAVTQGIPKINLSFFLNMTNLMSSREVIVNAYRGDETKQSFGGIGVALGVRYRFKKI